MKIKAGLYYRTRDGRKAFVAAVLLPNPFGVSTEFPVVGYIDGGGAGWALTWTRKETAEWTEWREPITKTVWVGMDRYGNPIMAMTEVSRWTWERAGATSFAQVTLTKPEGVEVQS